MHLLRANSYCLHQHEHRDDMTALLSKAGSKLTVKQLLDTLQETMEFEASITRKFGTSVRRSILYPTEAIP